MQAVEFYRLVQERLGLADQSEAEAATRSVLAALADRINRPEAKDMASQLPKELADLVKGRGGPVQKMDLDTFIGRIQSDLDLENRDQAFRITEAVFSVLKDAISQGEWEDVVSQLPRELQTMFVLA